ncbi:MAG TPA: DUF5611 family protein [Thermoplasmata archaeon]
MQSYPVRASHRNGLAPAALEEIAKAHFDTAQVEGDAVIASYGAISRLSARTAGRELSVDLTMNPKVPEDVARETIRRYNQFLEAATGYTSKERAKRMRKSAGKTSPGA